jgi:hypothetical protein
MPALGFSRGVGPWATLNQGKAAHPPTKKPPEGGFWEPITQAA